MSWSGFSTVNVVSGGIRVQTQPGGLADGDLTGSYDGAGPIVDGIQGIPVDPRVPNNGDSLIYNGGEWIPTPSPSSATIFQGLWDADANSPDIENFPGLADGYTWIVSVAGNTDVGGITGWIIGDYAVYSNGNWYKLSNESFGWTLTGNNGTNSNINFIGTADEHDLSIRANSLEGFRIFTDGNSRAAGSLNVVANLTASNAHFSGDVKILGGDITTSAATFNIVQASSVVNIGSSAGHVNVAGDLRVSGNDIKSSTNAVAIQLTGSDVTVSGGLISSGSLEVLGNVTGSNAKFNGTVSVSSLDSTGVVIANSNGKLITTGALTYKDNSLFVSSSLYVSNSVSASHFIATDGGTVKFVEQSGPHYTSFRAAQQTVDIEYSLPQTLGLDKEFLMSDGAGSLDWVDTRTLNWSLTGNASTVPGTNFIGTTDANPLILKTNSVEKLRLGTSNGSSLTGSLVIKNGNLNVSQKLILSGVLTPATLSTDQDNYSPAGIDESTTLRVSSTTPVNITGLADGNESGRIVFVTNIGANLITLVSESALSTAKNRFILPNPSLILSEGDSILLQYDEISQRWRAPATSKGTYAGNQKFRFFQATAVAGSSFGNYATVAVTANSSTNINFQIPEDSIVVEEVQVLGFPTSSQTNKSITYTGTAIQIGAAFNSRNATTTITTNLTANALQAFNAFASFQTLRAGDFCGLKIQHNNIGSTVDYIGVYITYR